MKTIKNTIMMLLVAVFISTGLSFTNTKVKAASNVSGEKVVSYAKRFLGKPYVYGGTSPSGFDCSGFVQYVYKHCGANYSLPRTTYGQIKAGKYVSTSTSKLKPGDIVFPHSGHVGIYIGDEKVIHAPDEGDVVKIVSLKQFARNGLYAARRLPCVVNSYVSLDGGGYRNYNGQGPGVNLIIRDYSSDVVRVRATVDSDSGASWSFDVNPPNSNYSSLYKNCHKVVTRRNGGSSFTPGATYKIKAEGIDKYFNIVCEKTITLKVPRN